MMCESCKRAGGLLKLVTSKADLAWVRALHNECKDPATCTCQHRTESAINEQR